MMVHACTRLAPGPLLWGICVQILSTDFILLLSVSSFNTSLLVDSLARAFEALT
jgi:hypothetical protein